MFVKMIYNLYINDDLIITNTLIIMGKLVIREWAESDRLGEKLMEQR